MTAADVITLVGGTAVAVYCVVVILLLTVGWHRDHPPPDDVDLVTWLSELADRLDERSGDR